MKYNGTYGTIANYFYIYDDGKWRRVEGTYFIVPSNYTIFAVKEAHDFPEITDYIGADISEAEAIEILKKKYHTK